MIYLDCAATSFQKPESVHRAVAKALKTMSSPGRGSYQYAMRAADTVFDCRSALAELFHVPTPENVVFTCNATHALNIAINSLVSAGDKVVISGYEHNAVTRPLHAIGADVHIAASELFDPEAAIAAFARELPGAKAAVCCHVSNVFGYILPVERIAALCRTEGVPLIIDASQSAGSIPIDFTALGAAFAAMPGHKGLLGPQGTGVLLCAAEAKPFLFGGTGSESASPTMPAYLPDQLEAGTHNVPGIAGLLAGTQWVNEMGPQRILEHERRVSELFLDRISGVPNVQVYRAKRSYVQTGVISVRIEGLDCEMAAQRLSEAGICVRSGLHCAPTAHRTVGTIDTGTIRFSISPFNTEHEINRASMIFREIVR
jgi:cysteine desulfurase family protein